MPRKRTKRIKEEAKKVQPKPTILNPKFWTIFLAIYLLSLLAILAVTNTGFFGSKQASSQDKIANSKFTTSQINRTAQASNSATLVSSSPSASPAPQVKHAVVIPPASGRSVSVPIIYYHYIGLNPNPADKLRDNLSVVPDLFDQQLSYLASSGFNPITLDTMYAALKGQASLPAKPIILTFDDGYVDFYVNAFPILRKYGFHAIAFIPTGLVGTGYYLNWGQIKEMDATGLISFQAHSINHPAMSGLSDAELKRQTVEPKAALEAQLGKKVNWFAYPYGVSNERVWQAVKDAGYIGATGTWGGTVETEGTLFNLPRLKIPGGLTIPQFAQRI